MLPHVVGKLALPSHQRFSGACVFPGDLLVFVVVLNMFANS